MSSRILFDTQHINVMTDLSADTTGVEPLMANIFEGYTAGTGLSKSDEAVDVPLDRWMWGQRIARLYCTAPITGRTIFAGPLLFPTLPVFPAANPPETLARPIIHVELHFSMTYTGVWSDLEYFRIGVLERDAIGGALQSLPMIVAIEMFTDTANANRLERCFVWSGGPAVPTNGHIILWGGPAQAAPNNLLMDIGTGSNESGSGWINRAHLAYIPPQLVYRNVGDPQGYAGEVKGFSFNGLSGGGWKTGPAQGAWVNQPAQGFMPENGIPISAPPTSDNPNANFLPFLEFGTSGGGNSRTTQIKIHRLLVWEELPASELADSDAPQAVTIQGYGEGLAAQEVKVINTEQEPVPIDDVSVAPGATLPPDA